MSGFVHIRRYGKKPSGAQVAPVEILGDGVVLYAGCRWNLRTGEKGEPQAGFSHTIDGRYLAWADNMLEVHGGAKPVRLGAVDGTLHRIVGDHVVVNRDARQPWPVFDAKTGKELGLLDAMRPIVTFGTPLYNAALFDPSDGATLWMGEKVRLVQFDIASRTVKREIEPAAEHAFIGAPAALYNGHVLALERPLKNVDNFNRDADRLVEFAPDGKRMRERRLTVMAMHVLGENFIVVDDRAQTLVVLDRNLEAVERIHMFEPGGDGFMRILPLPSGREFIGVGGRGEWDHYGEPGLGPAPKPPTKKEVEKAAEKAAKKSAAKKPGEKPAAKPAETKKRK